METESAKTLPKTLPGSVCERWKRAPHRLPMREGESARPVLLSVLASRRPAPQGIRAQGVIR